MVSIRSVYQYLGIGTLSGGSTGCLKLSLDLGFAHQGRVAKIPIGIHLV